MSLLGSVSFAKELCSQWKLFKCCPRKWVLPRMVGSSDLIFGLDLTVTVRQPPFPSSSASVYNFASLWYWGFPSIPSFWR
jgi:hypothetical protein